MSETITKNKFNGHIMYKNEKGETHNINDEPAFIWADGSKQWFKNGKLHRTKGPAIIFSSGNEDWYYEDNDITDQVIQLMADGKINSDWRNWTEEDEFLFVLLIS